MLVVILLRKLIVWKQVAMDSPVEQVVLRQFEENLRLSQALLVLCGVVLQLAQTEVLSLGMRVICYELCMHQRIVLPCSQGILLDYIEGLNPHFWDIVQLTWAENVEKAVVLVQGFHLRQILCR